MAARMSWTGLLLTLALGSLPPRFRGALTALRCDRLVVVSAVMLLSFLAAVPDTAAQTAARIASVTPASANPGDQVTIRGVGFGAMQVTIRVGGIPALVLNATGNMVRFIMPNGIRAGLTEITATNPGGLTGRIPFTVLAPAIIVTPDAAAEKTAVFSGDGGSITTTGANGISYMLTIPEGALAGETTVTITPVAIANFPMPGGILAAAQLHPEGLRFFKPATLTMVLPGPPPNALIGRGLLGFLMQDDGSALEPIPFSHGGSTFTLPVPHFTVTGVGSGVCDPTIVVSAVGIAACRQMAEAFTAVSNAINNGTVLDSATRQRLSAVVSTELINWLIDVVFVDFGNAADPTQEGSEIDYFFDVAVRELTEIQSINELFSLYLDVSPGVLTNITTANAILPDVLLTRQDVANRRCLADRQQYLTHVDRVLKLAGVMLTINMPVNLSTHGVSCVVLKLASEYPQVVPAGGAELHATVELQFSDGLPLPGAPLVGVSVRLELGFAVASYPLIAEGDFQAELVTTVSARGDEPNLVSFSLEALAERVGLRRTKKVERCRGGGGASTPTALTAVSTLAVAAEDDGDDIQQCMGLRVLGGQVRAAALLRLDGQELRPANTQGIPVDASGRYDAVLSLTSLVVGSATVSASASATETIAYDPTQGLTVTGETASTYELSFTQTPASAFVNAGGAASVSMDVFVPHVFTLSFSPVFSNASPIVDQWARILQAGAIILEITTGGSISGVLFPGRYSVVSSCLQGALAGAGSMSCSFSFSLTPQP